MKNSILILGIALVSLTNVCNASNAINNQIHQERFLSDYGLVSNETAMKKFSSYKNEKAPDNYRDGNQILNTFSEETEAIAKPSFKEDTEIFNPETVIAYNPKTVKEIIAEVDRIIENTTSDDVEFMAYEESMKEIIAQSDLIIENTVSNEVYPLYFERTMEDEITELEMIIENKVTNEVSPLDFKKINSNSMMINTFNSKTFVGMN